MIPLLKYSNFNQNSFQKKLVVKFNCSILYSVRFIFATFFKLIDKSSKSDLFTLSQFINKLFSDLFLCEEFFQSRFIIDNNLQFFSSSSDKNLFRKSIRDLNFLINYTSSPDMSTKHLLNTFNKIESLIFFIRKSILLNKHFKINFKLLVRLVQSADKKIIITLNQNFFFFFNYFSSFPENLKLLTFRETANKLSSSDLILSLSVSPTSLIPSVFDELCEIFTGKVDPEINSSLPALNNII